MLRTIIKAGLVVAIGSVALAAIAGGRHWPVTITAGGRAVGKWVSGWKTDEIKLEEIDAFTDQLGTEREKGTQGLAELTTRLRGLDERDGADEAKDTQILVALKELKPHLELPPAGAGAEITIIAGKVFPREEVMQEVEQLLGEHTRLEAARRQRADERRIIRDVMAQLSDAVAKLGQEIETLKTRKVALEHQATLVALLRDMRVWTEGASEAKGLLAEAQRRVTKLEEEYEALRQQVASASAPSSRPILKALDAERNPTPTVESRVAALLSQSEGQ